MERGEKHRSFTAQTMLENEGRARALVGMVKLDSVTFE